MNTSITDTSPAADQPEQDDRPRWPELEHGERVTITITDALVSYQLDVARVAFEIPFDGSKYRVHIDLPRDHPQVRIDRGTPADGVPQPGELWTDQEGTIYLAVAWSQDGPRLAGSARGSLPWREFHTGDTGPIRRLMTVDEIASYR